MATQPERHAQSSSLATDHSRNQPIAVMPREKMGNTTGDHNAHLASSVPFTDSVTDLPHSAATPPIDIPNDDEFPTLSDSPTSGTESYMDRYMRGRKTSISFSKEITTDSGHRQPIDMPLWKPSDARPSVRSGLDAFSETRAHRSHSESTRDHFDPVTGRHLPRFAMSPRREVPHIGEARFPILQDTVDEMARESTSDLSRSANYTTSSKPNEMLPIRDDQSPYYQLPAARQSLAQPISTSYDSPRPFRRTASERWKNGEVAQDFFSPARSSRRTTGSWRDLRRSTASTTKSPSSVASSFLRGFSLGSGGDDSNASVDSEGQTIGDDYVLGKQIGFGGFSIIREVTQLSAETGQQRKLAAKIVQRNIDGKSENENESAQAEFEHEVELWRFLSHPNILPLEAVYKLEEATFCFIPLNSGGTLFDLIRKNRGGMSLDVARNYAYQVASGIRYLHLDARVVHRDIKLENCLLEMDEGKPGLVRICDFGMAEWLQGDGSTSRSSGSQSPSLDRRAPKFIGPADSSTAAFAGGSLEYAAPEIVQRATSSQDRDGSPASRSIVSPAVDIWAFGVCLFTLIMGTRPFSDSFLPRVVMAILAGEWDREAVAVKLGNHPETESVLELLEGCLEMDERQRWRIRDVFGCSWFAREREQDKDSPNSDSGRGWRL